MRPQNECMFVTYLQSNLQHDIGILEQNAKCQRKLGLFYAAKNMPIRLYLIRSNGSQPCLGMSSLSNAFFSRPVIDGSK